MSLLNEILAFNQSFVGSKEYEAYRTDRFPDKRLVIVTCMDTRLTELLPRAMNVRNGDAKLIKVAGAVVAAPFGSVMRSILVAVYELGATEIAIVGHHGCGMMGLNSRQILDKAREAGISGDVLSTLAHSGIDLHGWLRGFESVEYGVRQSVEMVRKHPLLPPSTAVHGMVMSPETGKLDLLVDGYPHV